MLPLRRNYNLDQQFDTWIENVHLFLTWEWINAFKMGELTLSDPFEILM